MGMEVKIDVGKFMEATRKEAVKKLHKAGMYLVGKIKQKISQGQPYVRYGQKAIYYRGLEPSSPGQPPKLITGQLRASIAYEVTDDLRLRVGSNLPYAAALEMGTRHMQPRPYLRSTVIENADKIKAILGGA